MTLIMLESNMDAMMESNINCPNRIAMKMFVSVYIHVYNHINYIMGQATIFGVIIVAISNWG